LWQRELLGSPEDPESTLARQSEYWRGVLAGVPEELALPFDRVRPVRSSGVGGSVEVEVPEGLSGALERVARENGCTLYMVLQAAV
ncbi:condensation domain-containing protein, partial [Nocardiopsis sp. LOL_012]|uniref:condensation domain-containing protein n=1 Tax=Nocardiopsis sp. LOL_012 TaxID=3345409 RepID=UPI003A88B848